MAVDALPILGGGLGWLTLLQLPFLFLPALSALAGVLLWCGGLIALGMLVWAVGSGAKVLGAARREDANLVATRGEAAVRRWIVAHADTKAQGHSMAGRLVALWICLAGAFLVTALLGWRLAGGTPPAGLVAAAAGLVTAGGVLAGRGRLRGGSPGARDNGTGLLAALVAADRMPEGVGFLFPGAEEFGLAGARVWAETGGVSGGAEWVNLDTVTDRGRLYLLAHDARGAALAGRLEAALSSLGIPMVRRRLPAGILVDSVALARGGATACTIARLDWSDLRRIHTAGDTLDGLDPAAAIRLGEALAALG